MHENRILSFNYLFVKNILLIPLLMILLLCCSCQDVPTIESTDIAKIGTKAPDFNIQLEDGKTLKLSDLQGRIVLINFFATWWGACVKELPYIQNQIWEKYKNNSDFSLLVIGREHSKEDLVEFKSKEKIRFPLYPDPDKSISLLYAKGFIPRTYLINKQGIVVYSCVGFSIEEFSILTSKLTMLLNK